MAVVKVQGAFYIMKISAIQRRILGESGENIRKFKSWRFEIRKINRSMQLKKF